MKLRVLQLIQKKQFRGAEVFTCQLSNHLVNLGHSVLVCSIYDGPAELPFEGDIICLDRKPQNRYLDIKGWKKLANVVRDFKPHIVQANAADTLKYAIFSKMIFRWKTKVVFRNASSTSFYIRTRFSKKFNKFLLQKVDLILSVSKASKIDLNKTFPLTAAKSFVVPVGVEIGHFERDLPSPFDEHVINIIHIGSFTLEKNHVELFRIFQKIKAQLPSVVLHLVGEGPLRTDCYELVQKMDLGQSVRFYGQKEDISNYLKNADALLLPSLVEGLPAVVLEAMYCKVPVVAYGVGGISEALSGFEENLIPPSDDEEFVHAVMNVLSNPNEGQIEDAHLRIIKNYQNAEIVKLFLYFYKSLI